MAVGFPAKTTFANGNVLPASDLNDLAGTLNSLVNGVYSGNINANASTATALATARTINGVSFNGTANIKTHIGGQGATVVSAGNATDRITHGLGTSPSSYSITFRSNSPISGPTPVFFYVTNITSTYFDVYSYNSSGVAVAAPYFWIAIA
jgi:hypothetical protein